VNQLYVRVGCHGRGIGGELLRSAKQASAGSLWLYTFARNAHARRFYEHRGFLAVAFGFEPTWQLDDVKYAWGAEAPLTPSDTSRSRA
jgi:ribosomal protein S18 acetylase RimI-like enzyme